MDTIWTVLSGGRPVAAFNIEDAADAAEARQQAEAFIGDSDLREDLMAWEDDDGVPLWDGESDLTIREASPEEEAVFQEVHADAAEDEDFADDGDGFLVFLVPVNEPEDDEDEDEA